MYDLKNCKKKLLKSTEILNTNKLWVINNIQLTTDYKTSNQLKK